MARVNDSPGSMARKDRILSRRHIEGLIAEGQSIIVIDGKVIKADAYRKFHPGGEKVIMHMVGRDATDEVNAYVIQCVSIPQPVLICWNS